MSQLNMVTLKFILLFTVIGCSSVEEPTLAPQPSTLASPQIILHAVYPTDSALPGAVVTIVGKNFGETPGQVTLGDLSAHIIHWEDKQIDVVVPGNIAPGKTGIYVRGSDDGEPVAGSLPFTVLTPSLASLGLRVTGIYGPAVADFDLDGDADMFVPANYSESGIDSAYFINNGDATFSERALEEVGIPIRADSFAAVAADFDQDNDADLYVVGDGRDYYAQNKGNGTFRVQNLAEVGLEMRPDQNGNAKLGIAVADFDLDRDLDLFVNIGFIDHVDNFYALNNGDGTFISVDLAEFGIPSGGDGKYVTAADFNSDGAPDLWVGQIDSSAVYLLNNGDGTFSQQDLADVGLSDVGAGSLQAVADYDLDGDLDLFLGDTEPADDFACKESFARNDGNGVFTLQDLGEIGLLDSPHQFRGTVAADFNGDGFADIIQSGGFAPDGFYALNDGDGTFTQQDLSATGLAVDRTLGLPVAYDFDEDGDLDIFNHAIFARNMGDGTFVLFR